MTNFISGCQGAAGITKMKVMKATIAMRSLRLAGDDGTRQNSRGLTWDPVIWTGMRARMATMRMQMGMRMGMRRKKYRKSMMEQRGMCRIDLGPSDVDGYEGEDGDDADADADEEDEASQVDDGSTQNVED
jgi:hypothetical protein